MPTAAASSGESAATRSSIDDHSVGIGESPPDADYAATALAIDRAKVTTHEAAATTDLRVTADAPPLAVVSPGDHASQSSYEAMPVGDASATVPHNETAPPSPASIGEDIETFAVRHARRRPQPKRRAWRLPGLPAVITALVVANIILIGWRADVVKVMPQTASLYAAIGLPVNLRGVVFSNVTSTTETQDGVPVLVVEGTITSISKRVVEVPRLRFSIRNQSGQEVYAWTALPDRSLLPPGESLAFRSRLASPPTDAHDVIVRFFNRRDLVAGLQ